VVWIVGGVAICGAHAAARADSPSPAELRQRPSLRETGRMAPMRFPRLEITPAVEDAPNSRERPVRPLAAKEAVGEIDPDTLTEELDSRLSTLPDCLIEAARHERVPLSGISVDTLTLRFCIRPAGDVAGVEIDASSATDPEVVGCVESEMKSWMFTPPRGGPLPIERAFRFPATP
jgi:hypothetical protein